MTCNVQQQISKAMELIETARYRLTSSPTLALRVTGGDSHYW